MKKKIPIGNEWSKESEEERKEEEKWKKSGKRDKK